MIENSQSASYAAAGVDITAGYRAVELMKSSIARTMTAGVASDIGGFGGLFALDTKKYNFSLKHQALNIQFLHFHFQLENCKEDNNKAYSSYVFEKA